MIKASFLHRDAHDKLLNKWSLVFWSNTGANNWNYGQFTAWFNRHGHCSQPRRPIRDRPTDKDQGSIDIRIALGTGSGANHPSLTVKNWRRNRKNRCQFFYFHVYVVLCELYYSDNTLCAWSLMLIKFWTENSISGEPKLLIVDTTASMDFDVNSNRSKISNYPQFSMILR